MGSGSLGAAGSTPQSHWIVPCAARSMVMSKLMAKMPEISPEESRRKTVEDLRIFPLAVLVR